MNSLVAIPPTITITHPRIIAFYEKNPTISIEAINLCIINLLESTSSISAITEIQPSPNNEFQISELTAAIERIKTSVSHHTNTLSSEFLTAKIKYINEFRSVWGQSNCVTKRDYLLENNVNVINSLERLTLEIRNIKGIHYTIGEKISSIIKQFHKIIHTNIESILSKTTDTASLSKEFIHNFEINSAHMIQTIQQLLIDFISTKESQTKTAIDALQSNGDGSQSLYSKLQYELNDFLHHIRIQSSPNITHFETILARLYNTASINTDSTSDNNIVLSRAGTPDLFLQQCCIKDRNVNVDEIKTFLRNANERNQNGILISQHTGITSKPHLFIEILQNRVFLYIHNLEYSPEKLQTAIEMVDAISAKLSEFNVSSEERYAIPKEVLDEMNREYQSFIGQKEAIITTLKDTHKKLIGQIEEIRFMSLDKYLSTRYSSCKKQGYVCSLCNSFTVSTLKGLAAHKRGCNRKLSAGTPNSVSSSNTIKPIIQKIADQPMIAINSFTI